MRIKIYQIQREVDIRHLLFQRLDYVLKECNGSIAAEIYACVYDGEIKAKTLEDVYVIFNMHHPLGFNGHSLSVSDVVEVQSQNKKPEFYFCDSVGFKQIDFDNTKCVRRNLE